MKSKSFYTKTFSADTYKIMSLMFEQTNMTFKNDSQLTSMFLSRIYKFQFTLVYETLFTLKISIKKIKKIIVNSCYFYSL